MHITDIQHAVADNDLAAIEKAFCAIVRSRTGAPVLLENRAVMRETFYSVCDCIITARADGFGFMPRHIAETVGNITGFQFEPEATYRHGAVMFKNHLIKGFEPQTRSALSHA